MNIKNNLMEIIILIGVSALLFYSSNPIERPDTARYLSASLLDPPMYSTIINILQKIFGTLKSVIVFQTLLIGLGIIYFTRTVSNIFNLNNKMKILVSVLLFIPILQFYNNLLTEPLGYALSLLFVSSSIKLIYSFNNKNLILSSIFAVSLLLTRNQFMFLYPVILILFLGIFILHNSKKKLSKWLISSFIVIFLIHNSIVFLNTYMNQDSIEEDYVLSKNNNWRDSLTYNSMGPSYFVFIDAIYISSTKDVKLFENKNLQKILIKIFDEMNNRQSLVKYYDGRGHFAKSFSDIRDYSNPLLLELASEKNTSLSKLKREISIILISANFGKYIKQIFKKFYDTNWLFVFIPLFMLIAALINFLKDKSPHSLLLIFISTFTLANHSVVYLFGRIQPRYLIYSDFILLIFIFILFSVFLQNIKTIK